MGKPFFLLIVKFGKAALLARKYEHLIAAAAALFFFIKYFNL